METITKLLNDFWLSDIESQVYETSLSMWIFASSTLTKKIKIPRSTARYTCESLVKKWFMNMQKRWNTQYFQAENPTKLFAIMYQEEEKLKQKKSKINTLVSTLQKSYNPNATLPKISIYEWIDGINKMFDLLVEKPTKLYSFGAGDYFLEKEPDLIENFRKKWMKAYKEVYIIRSKKYASLHTEEPAKIKTKYFKHIDELKVDIQITDDKMTITSLWETKPVGIIIKHKEIVEAFENIFNEFWQGLDEISHE